MRAALLHISCTVARRTPASHKKIMSEGRADSHGPLALRLCSLSQRKARDCAPQRLIKVGKIVYAIPCFKFRLHAQIRKRL